MEREQTEKWPLHYKLGVVCKEKGDLDAAASHLTESLSLKRAVDGEGARPDVAITLHELGVVCLDGGPGCSCESPLRVCQHEESSIRRGSALYSGRHAPQAGRDVQGEGRSGCSGEPPHRVPQHEEGCVRTESSQRSGFHAT